MLVISDKLVFHHWVLEKMPKALFNMSRSC